MFNFFLACVRPVRPYAVAAHSGCSQLLYIEEQILGF